MRHVATIIAFVLSSVGATTSAAALDLVLPQNEAELIEQIGPLPDPIACFHVWEDLAPAVETVGREDPAFALFASIIHLTINGEAAAEIARMATECARSGNSGSCERDPTELRSTLGVLSVGQQPDQAVLRRLGEQIDRLTNIGKGISALTGSSTAGAVADLIKQAIKALRAAQAGADLHENP